MTLTAVGAGGLPSGVLEAVHIPRPEDRVYPRTGTDFHGAGKAPADCPRCEALREEVAYLKGELGLLIDEERIARLRRSLSIRPKAIQLLLALASRPGHIFTLGHLRDALDTTSDNPKLVQVYVNHIRKALGYAAIRTEWGRGYSLTQAGLTALQAIETRG